MSIFVFYKIPTSILQLHKILTSLSSFYQGSSRILQLFKWPCRTPFFYRCGALFILGWTVGAKLKKTL